MIEVIDPGRLTSVQDLGRPGYERFGVPRGGAADWFSAAVANRLVGNHPDAAVLEFAGVAPSLLFHEVAIIAITGAKLAASHLLEDQPPWQTHRIEPNRMIAGGNLRPGLRGYLAVRGGIDVPMVLGSRSLCERGAFGGGYGRPLRAGDPLPIGDRVRAQPMRRWPIGHRPPPFGPWEVRVIAGPHADAYPPDALDRLCAIACVVTPAIDRMGMRIDAPGLRLRPAEILTTPITSGAIQVTPSGQLIAMLVDHPTTGGYPVIATVISADVPFLAQARPGDTIRFRAVGAGEAQRALNRLLNWLDDE